MKRTKKIAALAVIALFLFSGVALADDAVIKLARGITNVLTSPAEYFIQYIKLCDKQKDPLLPVFAALVSGTAGTLERIMVGVYDIATFPIPVPADYKPLIMPATPMDAVHELNH